MAERISISVKEGDKELLEWIDNKVEKGEFQSRSHAFTYAVKRLKREGEGDYVV